MLLVGLTGGIGSGKSTVARMLAERGALVVDADEVAREVVAPGTDGYEEVVARFGDDVVRPDGSLDRRRLADLVFADPDARRDLNTIVHPRVGERIAGVLADAVDDGARRMAVVDVPLLVESGTHGRYDAIVVVTAPEDVRVERLRRGRGMTEAEARARISAQAGEDERLAVASHVVDNSGDLTVLEAEVDRLYDDLLAAAGPR